MSCYSENQIAVVVLDIIRDNPGIRTSGLIAEARRRMRPDGEDLEMYKAEVEEVLAKYRSNFKVLELEYKEDALYTLNTLWILMSLPWIIQKHIRKELHTHTKGLTVMHQ